MFYMETPDLSVESPFLLILENRTTLGQHFGLFPLFVRKWGVCPYKLEKNSRFFLESEENRRNFALSKRNRRRDNNKV